MEGLPLFGARPTLRTHHPYAEASGFWQVNSDKVNTRRTQGKSNREGNWLWQGERPGRIAVSPVRHAAAARLRFFLCCWCLVSFNVTGAEAPQGQVLGKEGTVDFARGQANWAPVALGQELVVADRLHTWARSRAMLKLKELGNLRLNELTTLEILPPRAGSGSSATLSLTNGAIYFYTRDRPRQFQIQAPTAVAASRGTEFLAAVDATGALTLAVFEGEAELGNALDTLVLRAGEIGIAEPGVPPRRTARIEAVNLVQWWLYYPAVLDLNDLPLTGAELASLGSSLAAYRAGDVLQALQTLPNAPPASSAQQVYLAALLLAAGQVDQAEGALAAVPAAMPAVQALRELIATVTAKPSSSAGESPKSASEWMARSYAQQARFDLTNALASARQAAALSPGFGYGWERVAELQFSFGRTTEAERALEQAVTLSGRNAQAWALKGFVAAARNRLTEAAAAFEQAIALDPGLGNGWLGRGLIRIRQGDAPGGRADLQTAAAMEPNRSLLRSYLAKAFDHVDDPAHAREELRRAKELDPKDPTPWLYSALLLRQDRHFNAAVTSLEESVALNNNRRVYRSRLLLDQDQAVRSAGLAKIYQDVGMDQVSVREAARAVAYDYGTSSAHLFLAESLNALRDPTRFDLRIETAWFNELLLANLLAPVGGAALSQNISQQEYARLFAGNRAGLSTLSEYRSDGQFRQLASQYGTVKNTSYAFDLDYQHNDGVRPNNALSRLEWYTTVKHQLTANDSLLVLTKYQDYHSGDNFQYYNPTAVTTNLARYGLPETPISRPAFSFDEDQEPLVVAGYHREWAPGVHTLALGGRLENDQRFGDQNTTQLVVSTNGATVVGVNPSPPFDVFYRSQLVIYTGELNQIFQGDHFNLVAGGRFQSGSFATTDRLTLSSTAADAYQPFFLVPPAAGDAHDHFERASAYSYHTIKLAEQLVLTAGLTYDRLVYPDNFRQPPIQPGTRTRDQVSPKTALVWAPRPELAVRGVYARGLGGVSFDESFRLEPTQLAGFVQSFRTLIPESLVGSVSAPSYELGGVAVDLKLRTGTYLGLQAEQLSSDVDRTYGVFDYNGAPPPPPPITPGVTPQTLRYQERSLLATVHQLLGDEFSLGALYRLTHSRLQATFPEVPSAAWTEADTTRSALLQDASVYGLIRHPSGFFARADIHWYHQHNFDDQPRLPSEDFVQANAFIGYQLRRQRAELTLGVLNLNDRDYHLNPLNLYSELPRERTFLVRLRIAL